MPIADSTPVSEPITLTAPSTDDLRVAASYIEAAMGRILVCVAALKQDDADLPHVRQAIARMLGEETHNDLDCARKIFETWKAKEILHAH